jgi:LPXTG-motif cell wall-anchored protein
LGTLVDHQSFTMDCFKPGATVKNSCVEGGGAVLTFTNTGESLVQLEVKKNGAVIDTVSVATGATETRTYPMAEDETATFRVTGGGFDSGDQQVTHNCVEATTTTTTPPTTTPPTTTPDTVEGNQVVRGTTLPRTGSASTTGLTTMAGLLLIVGGLMMALANRPVPATAFTRSRGR